MQKLIWVATLLLIVMLGVIGLATLAPSQIQVFQQFLSLRLIRVRQVFETKSPAVKGADNNGIIHRKNLFWPIFLFIFVWKSVNMLVCLPTGKRKPPAGEGFRGEPHESGKPPKS